jgi:glutathione S-transferase
MLLVIGNRRYSSWSLRPWIAMKQTGIPFEDRVILMAKDNSKAEMLKVSPGGQVPVLIDGKVVVHETIAILEYLNDRFPDARLWPADLAARAHARSVSAEMHAGYGALRRDCPMNICRPVRKHLPSPEALKHVERIDALWQDCRARYGQSGPFLFGSFTAADAMFAPIVNRLYVYDLPRSAVSEAYMQAMMALPAWKEWERLAQAETEIIASSEVA